jgi:hypothetical protein
MQLINNKKCRIFIKTALTMQSVLVIFNGIKFPYYLMEHAVSQAKAHSASLHAIFLRAKEETDEGYGFPSDLDQAVTLTDAENAESDDNRIIGDHMKLAAKIAETEGVTFTMALLTDSSLSEVLHIVNGFDLVFLDAAYDDDSTSMLTNKRFTAEHLVDQASVPVQLISKEI